MNYVIEQSRDNNGHQYYYHHARVEDLTVKLVDMCVMQLHTYFFVQK